MSFKDKAKQFLRDHAGKLIAIALGTGTVAGPVVTPPIVDIVTDVIVGDNDVPDHDHQHTHHQYVTQAEFEGLNEKINTLLQAGIIEIEKPTPGQDEIFFTEEESRLLQEFDTVLLDKYCRAAN